MTKKDFEFIASALNASRPNAAENPEAYTWWADTRNLFADRLEAANTRFDRDRFIKACEH